MSFKTPALLCDEMLLGLGRWLRAAGYDTALAPVGQTDRQLVEMARSEQRLLLTRDTRMQHIRHAGEVLILLNGNNLPEWAAELAVNPGIDWLLSPFSRCLSCNRPLREGSGGFAVAAWVTMQHEPVWHCPACRRAYWHGGHVDRMRIRLQTFAEAGEQALGRRRQDDIPPGC